VNQRLPRHSRANSGGFTLIEVLLSLAIFTVIGLATVRQIQQIKNTKDYAFEDMDIYNSVRAALNLMRSDLSQSFHILYDDLSEEARNAVLQNQAVAHGLFDGRKKELIFTALSHRNYYAGRRECEQTEISYFLHNRQGAKLPTLMKRESDILDDDLYQGGSIYSLVDDVVDLEFQYWEPKARKWIDDWNSDGNTAKDQFPMAVKVKLTVAGPRNQKLQIETNIKIAFPNNEAVTVQF
jgi:general secretion pathway protein J